MIINHEFLVWMSKSVGLFYLLFLSLAVVVYAYWPANKPRFDRAARSIVDDKVDAPWG